MFPQRNKHPRSACVLVYKASNEGRYFVHFQSGYLNAYTYISFFGHMCIQNKNVDVFTVVLLDTNVCYFLS